MKKSLIFIISVGLLLSVGIFYFYKQSKKSVSNINVEISNLNNMRNIIPVAIIGSGPAGLSASIYSQRAGYHTVVIEGKKPGGQLTETTYVENWPSRKKILGPVLMNDMIEQNKELGVSFLSDTISKVNLNTWPFELWTSEGTKLNALTLIIATGSAPRMLKVPGEHEYWGRGVTSCAICDAPFYKGKNVVVIGGGDSAAEQVLQLSPHVKHITMLVRGEKMRASQAMQDRVKAVDNATILYNKQIKQIIGDEAHVKGIEIQDSKTKETKTMDIDGVFLAIGHDPSTGMFKDYLEMDQGNYIVVKGRTQETSVPGVFAAGDVEDHVYMQAGIAAGAGIKAALDAGFFLQKAGFTPDLAKKLKDNYFDVAQAGPSPVKAISTEQEFEAEVIKSDKPVILDFWANHCPSCKAMLPTFDAVARKFADKVKFIKVNIDEAEAIVKNVYVLKIPLFIVYKDGEIVARNQNVMDRAQMTEFIQQFVK